MFFFFKQKTAYEMRISDWSSDVCSSDLNADVVGKRQGGLQSHLGKAFRGLRHLALEQLAPAVRHEQDADGEARQRPGERRERVVERPQGRDVESGRGFVAHGMSPHLDRKSVV